MKLFGVFCLSFLLTYLNSKAQIYQYSNSTSGAPSYVHTNATGTNIAAYGGSTNSKCAQGYSGRDGFNISSFSTSNPSLGIVVKPKTGYKLDITGFSVRSRRSGTGPQKIRMAYSLDGGSTWTVKSTDDAPKNGSCATSNSGTNLATWSVTLSVTSTSNGILFRVFPYKASSASGTIQIRGAFDINGTVTPVISCTAPTLSTSVTNVTCNGGNNGTINLTTTGGTSPFSYSWTGPNSYTSSSQNITGLKAGNYRVIVSTNGGCKDTAYATVTEPAPVVPSVSVVANPGNVICSGTSVTFTATPTNGGSTPSYQWKKNSSNVGTNSVTYTDNGISNNDVITCVMTSNAACVNPSTATSNTVTMTVNSPVTPSVVINTAPGDTICSGTSVTFTATPTHGGSTPSYQWKKNGSNVGTNSDTYVDNSIVNNDAISCIMTSSETCVTTSTATSNTKTITVVSSLVPSVAIAATSANICSGISVTFTATPTNGGASPSYQWKVNGSNVGTNSDTYTSSSLGNADVVTCDMTSSGSCATPATVTSNKIIMAVTPTVTPIVSISSSAGSTICAGASVTFTATPTHGGSSPSYQWKVNGANAGTNSNTFTTSTLNNNDVVTCVVSSNASCVTSSTATSNSIKMAVHPVVTPSITISSGTGNTICSGASVTFTATATHGGSAPSYQWKKNGSSVGTNSAAYTDNGIVNGDKISCVLTSNVPCATSSTANSNTITMTVNPIITPSLSISSSATTICSGTSVKFTATPTNGGSPSYQWKVNGSNVGSNQSTYTTTSLSNNDVVTCVLTTSLPCPTSSTATSNGIKMTVHPSLVPSLSITSSQGTQSCKGVPVTFTASAVNQGTSPVYQWKKNGVVIGANNTSYQDNNLNNGDKISCVLTSNAVCVSPSTITSNTITMVIDSLNTSTAAISSSSNDSVCKGELVTFYCHFTNGGNGYKFQWVRNGVELQGSTWGTYVTDSLADNDVIQCRFTNGHKCPLPVVTPPINIIVTPVHTPFVSVTAIPGISVAEGATVTFKASVNDAGVNPVFEWYKNSSVVPGVTGDTYVTSDLKHNDKIKVVLRTPDLPCKDKAFAVSNAIAMRVGTSVNEVASTNNIELFPNPNNGRFTLRGVYPGYNNEVVNVMIVNATGQVVYNAEMRIKNNQLQHEVDLNARLQQGIYILHVYAKDKHDFARFSIVK